MAQFYHLDIDLSLFDEQRAILNGLIATLRAGHPATVSPTHKVSLEALEGLQNLLDAITDQTD